MKHLLVVGLALTLGSVTIVTAQSDLPPPEQLFRGNETSLDLFGTVAVGESTLDRFSPERVRENGELGLGVGINHFPWRFVGFGVDAYSKDVNHVFVDNASANLIFRLPIECVHLAPYVYAGGGYQFEPGDEWFAQVGVGVDVRVTQNWGLFADARYVIPHHGNDQFGVGRAGIRFAF